MDTSNAWDWALLFYVATVTLKRTEPQFWRMTPRKLRALVEAHITINGSGDSEENSNEARMGYVDQIY